MPSWFSKKFLSIAAALAAGTLGVAGTISINVGNNPTLSKQMPSQSSFQLSGRTSHDAMQALVALGRLNALTDNPRSAPVTRAIEAAELEFGLPVDGLADQSLVDLLVAEIDNQQAQDMAAIPPADDAKSPYAAIGEVLAAFVSKFLSWQDEKDRSPPAS